MNRINKEKPTTKEEESFTSFGCQRKENDKVARGKARNAILHLNRTSDVSQNFKNELKVAYS